MATASIVSRKRGYSFPEGTSNPSWKGGRMVDKDGYVLLYRPEHPNARKSGYILEHRLVMESVLGRRLTRSEVVHHKEMPKSNNDPSNLELFSENREHLRAELTGRVPRWTPEGVRRITRERKDQAMVMYRGELRKLVEVCRETGIPKTLAHSRKFRGWPDDDLFLPQAHRRKVERYKA